MSTARNDITGDKIQTKPATDKYRNSPFWDQKKEKTDAEVPAVPDMDPNNTADTRPRTGDFCR